MTDGCAHGGGSGIWLMVTVQSGGGRLATAAIEPDGRIALTLYDVATGNLESTGFWARKFETDSWRVDGVVPG